MGEGGKDSQPTTEDSASKVGTKLKRLAILQMSTDFNPQDSPLQYHRASFGSLVTAVDTVRAAGLPSAPGRADGVDRNVAKTRAEEVFSLVARLHPTTAELNDFPVNEGLDTLFSISSVVKDFRLSDLLLDERISTIMMRLPQESFDKFMDLAKAGELPECFTSDQEMERLRPQTSTESLRPEDYSEPFGSFDRAGTSAQSSPPGDSARQVFFEEAVVDPGARQLKDDFDLDHALSTVKARFPQG